MKTETKRPTAEDAYLESHTEAVGTVEAIAHELFDLPAPSDMTHWGHVGDMNEINRQLRDVLARIKGEQR